jgi:phosphohistidine phosphatase
MELIMIRHGKAEKQNGNTEDAKRVLTAEGKKKLLKTMPNLGLLIKNLDKAQIWTSNLDRAKQTAAVISDLFGIQNIRYFDFIGDGNFDLLAETLAGEKLSSTVLIVGHEPFLSIWSQQLCGLALPFKKGAATSIRISKLTPLTAELLWFFQPQSIRRLGENIVQKLLF